MNQPLLIVKNLLNFGFLMHSLLKCFPENVSFNVYPFILIYVRSSLSFIFQRDQFYRCFMRSEVYSFELFLFVNILIDIFTFAYCSSLTVDQVASVASLIKQQKNILAKRRIKLIEMGVPVWCKIYQDGSGCWSPFTSMHINK